MWLTFGTAVKSVGLDGVWLTLVNLLQTAGVPGDVFDGIPVQNKWMTIVADSMQDMGKQDPLVGRKQFQTLMKNMVTGQMERIVGESMPVFLEDYGESCGIYKIVIGPRSVVVVSDPVILKHILTSSQENYTKGILSEVLEPIMGKGLIPADPLTWRQRRRAIVPGFHKRWLQDTTELMAQAAELLCHDLSMSISDNDGAATVNMEEKFTSASLDIIGKAIFKYEFRSVERESPVVRAVYSVLREAERRAQSVIPYWNLPGAATMFRDQKSHEDNLMLLNAVLDELIYNCMQALDKHEETPEGMPPSNVSLLEYLVMTRKEDVTTRQLRDDLMTLLIAGHETTAALLTWSLHELMKPMHDGILQRVLAEVDSIVADRRPTFDDMKQMQYLKWVLLETLRLYPQPPLLIRRCTDGDRVPVGPTCNGVGDSINFLPGQDIFISTWSLHRSTQLWGEDSATFNPDRWSKPIPGQGLWAGYNPDKVGFYPGEVATDYAFIPFGGGARKCVGDAFALLEAEVILVTLLQRFSFSRAQGTEEKVGMTTGATIHTTGGLVANVQNRSGRMLVNTGSSSIRESDEIRRRMSKKTTLSVSDRVKQEAMVVPTPAELRMLFTAQAEAKKEEIASPEVIAEAYNKCREVTEEHSKTFFLGSQLLPPDEQRVVWAIYNWCRDTDELIDGPEAAHTTMADLEAWEQRLSSVFESQETLDSSNWADLALADGARKFGLIQRPFQDMIGGMAMDLVKDRYETFQELEVYCYRVAGTVGVMTLPVLGFDALQNFTEAMQEQTISAAMALGVALQLTNILRDVGEDARRGRIYLPLEDLRRFSITEEEVIAASNTPNLLFNEERWKDFMEFQIERCQRFYGISESGIVGLSEVNRLGVMAALLVYGDILENIRRNQYDNFSQRAYVSLNEKIFLIWKAFWRVRDLQEVAQDNIRSGKIFKRQKTD